MFNNAYGYLKEHKNDRPDELRVVLNDMLGDGNIGYWHLIEQVLFFEEFLNDFETPAHIKS